MLQYFSTCQDAFTIADWPTRDRSANVPQVTVMGTGRSVIIRQSGEMTMIIDGIGGSAATVGPAVATTGTTTGAEAIRR
jgi:hypothetical protein